MKNQQIRKKSSGEIEKSDNDIFISIIVWIIIFIIFGLLLFCSDGKPVPVIEPMENKAIKYIEKHPIVAQIIIAKLPSNIQSNINNKILSKILKQFEYTIEEMKLITSLRILLNKNHLGQQEVDKIRKIAQKI